MTSTTEKKMLGNRKSRDELLYPAGQLLGSCITIAAPKEIIKQLSSSTRE